MKLKNMWKRFWTLDVHNHEGFTLVELIIVIAILAILSTGAIAGYSAYVEKANITADKALIAEIKNVLTMAYYSGNIPSDYEGCIVLSSGGAEIKGDAEKIEEVMKDAYGENWKQALSLKYSGWKGASPSAYNGSGYYGKEDVVMAQIGNMTGALSDVLKKGTNLIGTGFEGFLEDYHMTKDSDPTAVSNAAVLYVAQETAKNKELISQVVTANKTNPNAIFTELTAKGVSSAAALSVIMAGIQGFALATDQTFDVNFSESMSDPQQALASIGQALDVMDKSEMTVYFDGQSAKDLEGYISVMETVNNNKGIVDGNLGSANCFTDGTVEGLLRGYSALGKMNVTTQDGQIAIGFVTAGGNFSIPTLPLDLYE